MSLMAQTASMSAYQLPAPSNYHSIVQTASHVYLIGNYVSGPGAKSDVFMLPIRADGSLGPATRVSSLNTPRFAAQCFAMSEYLFAMGGQGTPGPHPTSIERAAINADGTLGPWITLGPTMWRTRTSGPAMTRGSSVYVVSGSGDRSVDRWTVDGSGAITFAASYSLTVGGVPTPYDWHTAAIVGSNIVVVGGSVNGTYSDRATVFPINADLSVGNGTTSPYALPQPMYAPGGISVLNGHLYVWGGANGSVYTPGVYRAPINPTTGQLTGAWATEATLNATAGIVVGSAPVTAGNRLWMLGGYDGMGSTTGQAIIQTTTAQPDGTLHPWSTYGGMTVWRYGHGSVVLGDKLWNIGGPQTSNRLTEYFTIQSDGALGPSTAGPNLAVSRYKGDVLRVTAGSNDYVYALGGYNYGAGRIETSVERAAVNPDGTLGPFVLQSVNLNQPRAWAAAAVVAGYVYCFGGVSGAPSTAIERAAIKSDGSLGAFQLYPVAMPDALTDHRVAVVGNYLYIVGGAASGTLYNTVSYAPIYPDGSLGAFSRGPSLVSATAEATLKRIGNYLYLFGGLPGSGYNSTVVQRALIKPDGTLNAWEPYRSGRYILPFATSYVNDAAVFGNYVYLLGGYQGTSTPVPGIAFGTIR